MRWLSGQVDGAATTLADGAATRYSADVFADTAFGNTAGASACYDAWLAAKTDGAMAADNLLVTLRSDVARLDQVIATFAEMDDEAADIVCSAGNTLTFVSAHTHSGASLDDDFIRGEQNHRLVDLAAGFGTPGLVGADLNENLGADYGSLDDHLVPGLTDAERGMDNYSAESIAAFDDHGYPDAGPAGPTSNDGEGQRIDHLRTRGLLYEDARVVDGGPSDHHGQTVEITLPRW